MEETLKQLTNDIATLKVTLWVVVFFLFVVTTMLVFAFKALVRAAKNTEKRADSRLFQDQAEELLDSDSNKELSELSNERVNDYPGDAWGHYYLAVSAYRLKDYIIAKQHFVKAGELNPQLKPISDDNIKEIESILSTSKPKAV